MCFSAVFFKNAQAVFMNLVASSALQLILDKLGQRIKEHKSSAPSRIPSAVKEHSTEAHHTIDWDNVKILDREDREFPRQVKEAIQIRKHSPALNRDQGLEIPSIYNVIIRPKVIKGQ